MSANTYKGAKGLHLYARLCAALMKQPMTTNQLSEACDCYARHMGVTMRGLRDRGVIYVQSWVRERQWAWWTEVWAFGPGTDAPRPLTRKDRPNSRTPRPQFRIETFMFGLVIKALEEGADQPAICDLTGLHRTTIQALIRCMRELKMIHVCEWLSPDTGSRVAVYKLGDKRHAPRPRRRTDRERNAAHAKKTGARAPGRDLHEALIQNRVSA